MPARTRHGQWQAWTGAAEASSAAHSSSTINREGVSAAAPAPPRAELHGSTDGDTCVQGQEALPPAHTPPLANKSPLSDRRSSRVGVWSEIAFSLS